jgi:hypothetical protein
MLALSTAGMVGLGVVLAILMVSFFMILRKARQS